MKFSGIPGTDPVYPDNIGIVGKLTGTVTGKSPFGEHSAKIDLDTVIHEITINTFALTNKVIQSSKRMMLYTADSSGSGAINSANSNFTFTVHGIEDARGETLSVHGQMGPYSSQAVSGATFTAPMSGTLKGSIQGQAVSGTASEVNAELISWD